MADLRQRLESGELKRIVLDAFEIEELQKKYKINNLEVMVSLKEINSRSNEENPSG